MSLKNAISKSQQARQRENASRTAASQAGPRRRNRLRICLCAILLGAAPLLARAGKYNVLFLISDDLRTELGCYGVGGIQTPHIDRLASGGVRFSRAYAQYPLCNPSRTSVFTGRYPTVTGVLDNRTWFGALHPEYVSMPKWFRQHGYASLRAGKIFHGSIDDADAWTEGGEPRKFEGAKDTQRGPQDPKKSDRIIVLPDDGESAADHQTATRTIDYLRRYKDRPFFLSCGFSKPHSPPAAPRRFFDLYEASRIPLPADFAPRPTIPPGFPELCVPPRNADLFIGRDASESEAREVKRAYWASVSFMDSQVGRVLRALDELGLRENTVVVFWGDNGYHLGEKGKWSKANSLFEHGTHIPLILSLPGNGANGRACESIVESLDLYPTLVELCGIPAPDGLQGRSLVPLLRNPKAPSRRPAYSVTMFGDVLGRAVRTERWRYVEWDEGRRGSMLFDHDKDPLELRNLAEDPGHTRVVSEMRKLLEKLPGRTR